MNDNAEQPDSQHTDNPRTDGQRTDGWVDADGSARGRFSGLVAHENTTDNPAFENEARVVADRHAIWSRDSASIAAPAPATDLPAPAVALPAPTATAPETSAAGNRRRRFGPVLAGALAGALVATGVSAAMTAALRDDKPAVGTIVSTANGANTTVAEPVSFTVGSISNLVRRVSPSVVRVKVEIEQQTPFGTQSGKGEGTGVILTADGELLTNAHVVDSATNVTVTLSDGTNHKAKVLGVDTDDDIAVVKILGVSGLTPAVLGDSSKTQVGEPVVAVGDALGLDGAPTVTTGIVSGLNRSLSDSTSSLHGLIQTDAAINHGNSGGPLLNAKGEVIGINTAIAADANNIGFSIPINSIKPLVTRLEKGETVSSDRTYLGISTLTLTDEMRDQLDVAATTGAVIGEVGAGTAAERAGLRTNDVVVSANGTKITSAQQLTSIVHHLQPGDHLKLVVERGGETIKIDAVLGTRSAAA